MRAPTTEPTGWSRRRRRLPGNGLLAFLALVALLGGAFVVTPAPAARANDLTDAINRQKALDAQIARQKAEVAALAKQQHDLSITLASTKQALGSVIDNLDAVRAQVVQATVDVAEAQSATQVLDTQVGQLDLQLADLEAAQARKQAELDDRKAILADRIRQVYDDDRTSLLETLLTGATFTDVLTDVSDRLDFAAQDRALAQEVVADQQALAVMARNVAETRDATATLQGAADAQRVQLQADLASLADSQARLAKLEAMTKALLAQQQAAYARMAKNKQQLAASIAADEKAQEQLQKTIDRLIAQQAQNGRIPSVYNGTLAWPMSGIITQEFGCTGFWAEPPLGSCAHFHRGIDIAAPMYTPIRAAADGTVLFAGPNPYDTAPKAWIVIIAHSSQLLTWYAHVDNVVHPPVVRAGDHVVQGQVIAYEGMTGHTTGPHLHWAVELNDTFVNPRLFL